jgi:UDP:flavonoid glycosyltransferase YjiC (YdhE family)
MSQRGHFSRLVPIIEGLVRSGAAVHVFTDRLFHTEIEAAGGVAVDLYSRYSIEKADSISQPNPCRYISFADAYAEAIAAEVQQLSPSVVLYDTFAYIGFVVARILDLPGINVCAGHNQHPGCVPEQKQNFPSIHIGPACRNAVENLKMRYGIDADPFAFLTALSPQLNIICEPPQFLPDVDRGWFEPVAFFGSVRERQLARPNSYSSTPVEAGSAKTQELRLYISFGTVIWSFYPDQARAALQVIVKAVAEMPQLSAVVSLGNSPSGDLDYWAKSVG